jgi:extradiol dioxygenase family protein
MSSAPQPALRPFHLAIPVHDIEVARHAFADLGQLFAV